MRLRQLKTYIKQSIALRYSYPKHFNVVDLIQFFPKWVRSLDPHFNPLSDQLPWISFSAIKFLDSYLDSNMRVYEYGSGGSTLYFSQRVGEVISTEHNHCWFKEVLNAIEIHGYSNCKIHLVEPTDFECSVNLDPAEPDAYISINQEYIGKSFQDYASNIDEYPDQHFDLILIDGRARPSCFKHAVSKVKPHGYIIWDNTDRKHYFPGMKSAPTNFDFIDFPGVSPYVDFFTRTSAWYRKY